MLLNFGVEKGSREYCGQLRKQTNESSKKSVSLKAQRTRLKLLYFGKLAKVKFILGKVKRKRRG